MLNGERLPIKSFTEYVDLYLPDKSIPRIHERVNDRWEVVIAATSGQFQQVSQSAQIDESNSNAQKLIQTKASCTNSGIMASALWLCLVDVLLHTVIFSRCSS